MVVDDEDRVKELLKRYSKFKPSKYNFLFIKHNEHFLFNTLSRCFIRILDKSSVLELINKKVINRKILLENKEISLNLLKGGFIVPSEYNEIEIIKYLNTLSRYQSDFLNLTIAMTLNCNFACSYCYENQTVENNGECIKKRVMEGLFRYLEGISKTIKGLNIVWYGGEPLLCMRKIEVMSERIMNICQNKGWTYKASMITNGYLLSEDVSRKLNILGINHIQVTLDGPEAIHDKRRPLKSGKGTFEVIIRNLNILLNSTKEISVGIRINVDRDNIESIEDLLNFLSSNFDKRRVKVYFGPTLHVNPDIPCSPYYFSEKDFGKQFTRLINIFRKYGYYKNYTITPVFNRCLSIGENAYAIDPDGNLYKCWIDIGNTEHSVGRIKGNGKVEIYWDKYLRWLNYDPISVCKECVFLPLCAGGCYWFGLNGNQPRCSSIKFSLVDSLFLSTKNQKGGDNGSLT
ncbi:hypothetical protein DRQ23_09280 [bacterium]|nr:MAG: hypothetical protein DRQ23_09280 [bacterium]